MKKLQQWIRNWKGIQHWQRTYSVSARIGKHFCPNCQSMLKLKEKSQVVNSESDEAKNFDFLATESYMLGNVKFVWEVYCCEKCNLETSIKDIRINKRKMLK